MKNEKNDQRKLIPLKEMLKKKNIRGRMNLLGKRLRYADCLPIRLEQKGNAKPLSLDLNQIPHLLITGGTTECQTAVVRHILENWTSDRCIKPIVIDLAGSLSPKAQAASAEDFINKLHEMLGVLECRYDELAKQKFKNTKEYMDHGHNDMPFHPIIIFGFEKMAGLKYRNDAETLICKLAQKGRAAGINLILCTTAESILQDILDINFPEKLTFRSNDEKDFFFSDITVPKINVHEANGYIREFAKRHTGVDLIPEFPDEEDNENE